MKKFMVLIMIFALLMSFAACGSANDDTTTSSEPESEMIETEIVEVTDEAGEVVTDENGEKVTELITIPHSSAADVEAGDTLPGSGNTNTVKPSSNNENNGGANSKPTEKPETKPTEKPTQKPTKPTERPTEKPTEKPTQKPTEPDILTFEEVGVAGVTRDLKAYAESIGLIWEPWMTPENTSWAGSLRYNKTDDYNYWLGFLKRDMRDIKSEGYQYVNFFCRIENNQFVIYELYA